MKKGAYIVSKDSGKPDVILIGNGSEVSTLIEGAELLRTQKGLKVQIVSVPSEGVFRNQSKEYQNETLPPDIPKFGLTAGLPVTLEGLTDGNGMVAGLDHFGYSAPYKILDIEFGFTGEDLFEKVIRYTKYIT
jgi:transketolase